MTAPVAGVNCATESTRGLLYERLVLILGSTWFIGALSFNAVTISPTVDEPGHLAAGCPIGVWDGFTCTV